MKVKDIKGFTLFGNRWKVKFHDKIINPNDDCQWRWGDENSGTRRIRIAEGDSEGNKFSERDLKHTYYHELMHACLDEGQYLDASCNEPMVEWLAKCLVTLGEQGKLI